MNEKGIRKTTGIIGAAIVLIAVILVFGTIFLGKIAGRDTEKAVRNVSLLYLDELAVRREQVVSSKLENYIRDIDVALSIMEKKDLESTESLQSYLTKIKRLYDLEKFAFVDSKGTIFTSMGTKNDIESYNFDPDSLKEPEISVKNIKSADKKVVIAVPVDNLPFEGTSLTVCFMEIDMDSMLSGISLKSDNNNTTFCNIYTPDGISLTNLVLGGLAREDNLLSALEKARYDEGYSYDSVKKDFSSGSENVVSFTYNGIKETLYYVPVHGTDWMLTYLIRESVIDNQISAISQGIITRSLIQSVLTALVLILTFLFLIWQMRRAAKATLEKELSETENRVKQQELEEQLALQEELLEQEKKRAEQDKMITAMSSDYKSIYYVDLDENSGICYRKESGFNSGVKEGERFKFTSAFKEYALNFVDEKYRDEFLKFIEPDEIRNALSDHIIIAYRYLTRRDGEERYEMLRMAGVRHPGERDDNLVHSVGVGFTDIDDEMRDALSRNNALNDALKSAEEANKAKTVFLSNMSHEIRTPMNAIIGLDSLALNEPDVPENVKNYLNEIGKSADHLLNLINDILDMSRIESGRVALKNEEFAFSKLIEEVNTMFNGQCKEKDISYNCHMFGHIDEYYIGDRMKLKQVLINILGNAVKFTEPGGSVNLSVEKTAGFDKRSTLRFVISDTGIGMSPEFLPKLFETFSQENESSVNEYGSSGLGMAITKNIVELMNGRIDVESEKGKGTTFIVTLTLSDADRKESTGEDDIEISPFEMTVLVVDDDPIACDHAKLVLSKSGINCETVLSGKEALDMVKLRHARMEPYNLIIIDWKMPEMDGVETARAIRSEISDESAIIILTAYNWDDVLNDAMDSGVDSFISKPLFTGTLMDEYKNALKKKSRERSESKKRADLKGRKILIAEDMEVNAKIMMKVLEMEEMSSELAGDGKAALNMFKESPVGYYDAILMDMRMPEMNGLEATEAIRALDREDAKTIPIIALTANAFDEDVQRSLQAGLNAHLSKPVQPKLLFETLGSLIKDKD